MIDDAVFVRLIVRYEAELRGFATTLMPRPEDAEDVVQEACVAMWKRIDDLESEAAFRRWAYSFVRFTALNKIRKQKRSPLLFSAELVEILAEEAESEAARAQNEHQALASCLEKLPPGQRDLLRRYYSSGTVRMKDIAEALKRNVAGLHKALQRTRKALRICIEEQLSGAESGR